MIGDRPGQDGRPPCPAARTLPLALLLILAPLLGGLACAPGQAESRHRGEGLLTSEPRALAPPGGRPAAIEALCWGGSPGDRRLGALFDDGRFATYRPVSRPDSVSVGLVVPGRGRMTSLAILSGDRAVTGDERGLVLWDVSEAMARPLGHVDCGVVRALAVEPLGPNDLFAGLEDGRLLRFRPDRERIGEPRTEARSTGRASGVRGFGFLDGGRSVVVLRDDGQGERRPRLLDGPPEPIGPARAMTESRDRIIRILGADEDGPALDAIGPDGMPAWRFSLPAEGVDLAPVLGGDGLIVCCEGRVLLMRPPRDGPPRPTEVRGVPAEGITRVAADPTDLSGRRVALADAAGRLLVYDAQELARSAAPIPLDNAAELAFRPQRRAHYSRTLPETSSTVSTSRRLADRIAEARRLLDRGEVDTLRVLARDLEADPALDRDAAAEIATLTAAVRQETGWPDLAIRHPLGLARDSFALRNRPDREADLRLWSGSLLIPSFDGRGGVGNAVRIEEALAEFRRASELFRQAHSSLERQARIAEAMTAWGLLALGRPQAAQAAFAPVALDAEHDPVLRQAPEFDRIAAALAVARRDWEAADLASDRLLRRLTPTPPDRLAMAREAALERVGNLAALGRWAEAAVVLDGDRPGDPEWTLRRATVRRRAGLDPERPPDHAPPEGSADSPERAAMTHVYGRLAVTFDNSRADGLALLTLAAEAHRRAGRSDLAIEADLERAEALERLGRPAEAIELFARTARTLVTETDLTRIRGAARPVGFATGRAYRGLARCQLALGRADRALGALDQATLASWFERAGEARVRSSTRVAPPGGSTGPRLKEARRSALDSDLSPAADSDARAQVRQLEVRHAAGHRELALTDPTRPFDPSSLALSGGEAVLVVAAIGPESLAGFLIRTDRPILARELPIRRPALRRAVRLWRSSLEDGGRLCELEVSASPDGLLSLAPEPDIVLPDLGPAQHHQPAAVIVDGIFGPFLEAFQGLDRLVVVPDDGLASLPVEALAFGPGAPELPEIRYAPSLSLLKRSREGPHEAPTPGRSVLIASARDPVTALAVRSAHGVGEARVEVMTDLSTLPARLRDAEQAPRILHLSAFALLDPAASTFGEPELVLGSIESAMVEVDGPRLSGSDVLSLNLGGAVVLLGLDHWPEPPAAEPTAWRDLAACWLAAGAEAVIVSLWAPPADSCPTFAAELHRALSQGRPAPEALAQARRALAERPSTADPVHWAGFVLYE